ncbi:hypothetical protein PENTCL1PPCAC_13818, partial [Pristionchus entomophagus]
QIFLTYSRKMFEIQQHPPIGYDGKQFDNSYSEYALSPEFGSPPNRCVPPPPQFQQDLSSSPSMRSSGPMSMPFSPIVGGMRSGMAPMHPATSTPRSYRNYSDESPVKNGRRYNNRSQFTPSRSPPTSLLSSPSFHRARNHLSDDSRDDSNRSYDLGGRPSSHRNNTLPVGSFDPQNGQITYTFERIVEEGVFEKFAKDKAGCHYLQENYPEANSALRRSLFREIDKDERFFEEMCKDVFANFFVQRMIEKSTPEEQRWIAEAISRSMFPLCMNRYSCRVIQKAIEHLPDEMKVPLLDELHNEDLVMLTVDQNANHVIQKIFNSFDLCHWSFIIVALMKENSFFSVVENKYGCRVIQLAIELLSELKSSPEQIAYEHATQVARRRRIGSVVEMGDGVEWATISCGSFENPTRDQLLQQMMSKLVEHCERLSSNEFANYVIQHVITADCLSAYRDLIIERCLLCKLLSLSQEKYASHVVEKALEHAAPQMLKEMMDEIFDGYVPHPETKKDALDILLFHQFGNYVVQRMLTICLGIGERKNPRLEPRTREHWMLRLEERINRNAGKLLRYSSGKKILDMLRSARGQPPINHGVSHSSHHQNQHNSSNHYHHQQSHSTSLSHNPRVPDQFR